MNLLRGGGAHYVFPCFEKPHLKTWIELSVAHKGDFHVLTTMPLVDTTNVYVYYFYICCYNTWFKIDLSFFYNLQDF